MSSIVFDNVSKRFLLHHEKARSFEDLIIRSLRRRNGNGTTEEFWALRDVSFEVPQGQMIGLIGPNGCGKSTTLKLIARIYEPTRGRISVKGRLNALIELGAGFHEELTGRENIYLNAALLGLTRRDIDKHFDEIVDFSELEKFIDTPVKRYSSGMHVRLGFAIATCIDSDILLVDEVLAVGDASFQRKCMERIAEIRQRGTTIFFVSHNAGYVDRLCDRALLIVEGRVVMDDVPARVIEKYYQTRREAQAELEQMQAARRNKTPGPDIFKAEYLSYDVPQVMNVNGRYEMTVTVRNQSAVPWCGRGSAEGRVVSLSYHWLERLGSVYQLLGVGTPMPREVPPGETVTITSPVLAPAEPGHFRLEIDLMVDRGGWFSRRGCLGPQVRVDVLPSMVLPDSSAAGQASEPETGKPPGNHDSA